MHGITKLVAAGVAVVLVWLVLLPWLAAQPRVADRIQWLDEERVDPSAMYYTELEMMEPIFDRMALERRRR